MTTPSPLLPREGSSHLKVCVDSPYGKRVATTTTSSSIVSGRVQVSRSSVLSKTHTRVLPHHCVCENIIQTMHSCQVLIHLPARQCSRTVTHGPRPPEPSRQNRTVPGPPRAPIATLATKRFKSPYSHVSSVPRRKSKR